MAAAAPSPSFPRLPLLGAAALVCLTILGAGIAHRTGAADPTPTTTAVAARDIRFIDQADGGLAAYDADNGALLGVAAPGSNGFLRGALHSIARVRRQSGIGPDPAFRLTAWQGGRLTLDDPTTGERLDLEAFGVTNEEAFARFLQAPAGPRP